jgi:processing peptidase subunit alpha
VENIGALTTASCGREQIIYTIDLLRDNAERGLSLLADSILNPLWTEEDVEITKNIMAIQTEDLFENPQALLQEYVHAAAYGSDAPLGRPLQCPIDKIGNLTLEKVQKFRQEYFVAPRMVVAGSGIEHETLVNLTKKYFDKVPSGAAESKYQAPPIAQYKGGVQTIENKESPFSYATLAFPSGGWHHDDLVPVCVLHTLLGGGDSFSAGGPGKGMYSRLYTSVLNRFHWVESCFAFSSLHADVGLLGIYGACLPSHTPQLIMLLANQLLHIAYVDVNPIELARAKNQLKSSVLMNLESRMILYEDIGRQLLTYGQRESPESICEKIDQVTAADLKRIMQLAMESPPSVVYSGDLTRFPAYEEVANAIENSLKMAKQQQQQQ